MGQWLLHDLGSDGLYYAFTIEMVQEKPLDLVGFVAQIGFKLIVFFDNANMFF